MESLSISWTNLDRRLREVVRMGEEQYGFIPGRGTTDACFVLRQLQEKFLEKDRELYMVFVDLEKAFDRVPRKVIEYALRKKGVTENMARAVMETYEGVEAVVTEEGVRSGVFEVKVGVHQGSVLSPLLFACVMDVLTEEVRRKEGCWCLLYADDIVLVAESKQKVMEWYREWKTAIEVKGLKVNEAKTKGMRCSRQVEVKDSDKWPCGVWERVGVNSIMWEMQVTDFECGTCRSGGRVAIERFELGDVSLEGVSEFKYLGDVLNDGGGCEQAVRNRVQAAWWSFRVFGNVVRKVHFVEAEGNYWPVYKCCLFVCLFVFNILDKKCERSFLMRGNPRKISWTVLYRRKHKKGSVEEVSKKRTRRNVKFQRAIQGATLETILAKRNQKPEVRKAQREQAIRAAKDKIRKKKEAKKMTKAAQQPVKTKAPTKQKGGRSTGRVGGKR
ncbi:uncharacterized protein LOC124443369 [Xenia sp. Carnegie-2017]|uniref:uncharacterized protein LOC124443369 n=1 Tax=Xenia sp. Carnegie-2017 TaxID=2897299 RepID=UPI001F039ABA|nr:uncharacterized protein LOC124443369 [Xenia sp. Carnegie-2017]